MKARSWRELRIRSLVKNFAARWLVGLFSWSGHKTVAKVCYRRNWSEMVCSEFFRSGSDCGLRHLHFFTQRSSVSFSRRFSLMFVLSGYVFNVSCPQRLLPASFCPCLSATFLCCSLLFFSVALLKFVRNISNIFCFPFDFSCSKTGGSVIRYLPVRSREASGYFR